MKVIGIWVVLFFISFVYNVFQQDSNDAILAFAISSVSAIVMVYLRYQKNSTKSLLELLNSKSNELSTTTIWHNGKLIGKEDVFIRYRLCISAFIFTGTVNSCPVLIGSPIAATTRILFTIITLVFGWWSIPSGPIVTIHSLIQNLKNGKKYTVQQLLEVTEKLDSGFKF